MPAAVPHRRAVCCAACLANPALPQHTRLLKNQRPGEWTAAGAGTRAWPSLLFSGCLLCGMLASSLHSVLHRRSAACDWCPHLPRLRHGATAASRGAQAAQCMCRRLNTSWADNPHSHTVARQWRLSAPPRPPRAPPNQPSHTTQPHNKLIIHTPPLLASRGCSLRSTAPPAAVASSCISLRSPSSHTQPCACTHAACVRPSVIIHTPRPPLSDLASFPGRMATTARSPPPATSLLQSHSSGHI